VFAVVAVAVIALGAVVGVFFWKRNQSKPGHSKPIDKRPGDEVSQSNVGRNDRNLDLETGTGTGSAVHLQEESLVAGDIAGGHSEGLKKNVSFGAVLLYLSVL
jgi:hypothetical protein